MRRSARAILLVLATLVLTCPPIACLPLFGGEMAARRAAESILADDLQRHVDVLADDTFEGRKAGSRGGRAAGGYLVQQLQRAKIQPAGVDGGYFQPFGDGYRNILGMIPGSDPELADEVIVVGAHYDHVGYGSPRNSYGPIGYIHNGADDNASGTAGVLELMRAFATMPAPRRTILFALFDGEEIGLLGSKHWLSNPTLPVEKVRLMINVDMIGRLRNERVEVFGTRTSRGLRRRVSLANVQPDLTLDFSWKMKANSDHHPFFERGIPVLMLHTGLHDDYHRPSDEAHKINSSGLESVVRLLFYVVHDVAEGGPVAPFRSASRQETPRDQSSLEMPSSLPGPRFGISWKTDEEEGLLISDVLPGSAADTAGLAVGDRLLNFDGRRVVSGKQLQLDVWATRSPTTVIVQQDDQEPRELTVELTGEPSRLGISWREDSAEPGTLVVVRVLPGSAAAHAGLRPKDRIYMIQDRPFADGNEFRRLAWEREGPLELLIERSGRLRTVRLAVPAFPAALRRIDAAPFRAAVHSVSPHFDLTSRTDQRFAFSSAALLR